MDTQLIEQTGHENKAGNVLRRDLKRRLETLNQGLRTAIGAAWDAGALLVELKARTAHGEWLPYLDSVGLSDRQAQKYMQLFRGTPREVAIGYDSINEAVKALTKPAAPEPPPPPKPQPAPPPPEEEGTEPPPEPAAAEPEDLAEPPPRDDKTIDWVAAADPAPAQPNGYRLALLVEEEIRAELRHKVGHPRVVRTLVMWCALYGPHDGELGALKLFDLDELVKRRGIEDIRWVYDRTGTQMDTDALLRDIALSVIADMEPLPLRLLADCVGLDVGEIHESIMEREAAKAGEEAKA